MCRFQNDNGFCGLIFIQQTKCPDTKYFMDKLRNYINGILTTPYSNNYINVTNPSTGEVYTMIPDSNEEDVTLAVASAEKAFPNGQV